MMTNIRHRERFVKPVAINGCRLYTGDCLKVLHALPDDFVDVVVTSPPYNIGLKYNDYADRRAHDDYIRWLSEVACEIKCVMKPDASFFLNIAGTAKNPHTPFEVLDRLRRLFTLQNHIVWVKSITVDDHSRGHFKPMPGDRYLHQMHEHIFHFTKRGDVALNREAIGVPYADKSNIARRGHAADLRCRGNTWFIPYETVQSRDEKFNHPGTFPIALPQMCIRLHGVEGATVLDPFMGTGTTMVAAAQEAAFGVGIDIDPSYVKIARLRLTNVGLT